MVMGQCCLSVRLFLGGQHSRRDVGLLRRLHGKDALSMVMVNVGFLWGCCVGTIPQPPEYGGAGVWLQTLQPENETRIGPNLVRERQRPRGTAHCHTGPSMLAFCEAVMSGYVCGHLNKAALEVGFRRWVLAANYRSRIGLGATSFGSWEAPQLLGRPCKVFSPGNGRFLACGCCPRPGSPLGVVQKAPGT